MVPAIQIDAIWLALDGDLVNTRSLDMKREISAARSRREKGKDAIVRIKREDKKILHVKVIDDTQTFPPIFLLSD